MTKPPRIIDRRDFLKLGGSAMLLAATGGLPFRVFAQGGRTFVVVSHAVHQTVATTGAGGDLIAPWTRLEGLSSIDWRTAGIAQVHETLFREASLNRTTLDVGYILNTQLFPRIANMFDPLDGYLDLDPIDDFGDFFPGTTCAVFGAAAAPGSVTAAVVVVAARNARRER